MSAWRRSASARTPLVGAVDDAAEQPGDRSHDFVSATLLGATFGLGFGGSLRHLSDVVPSGRHGETMSAFYLLAYTAMAVPTLVAGWAATAAGS